MIGLFKTAIGDGNMELRETPDPKPGPGQVVVEVKAAGICGSDLHIFHSDVKVPIKPPVIVGHEFSGTISKLGDGVTGWKTGERVTAEPSASICGQCVYCRTGYYNLCPERKISGFWVDGAFARYTVVPQDRLHRLPDNVDFLAGALTEPLACCVHGVAELTGVSAGDNVAITGPGPIGILSMQLAKAFGAQVIVIGTEKDSGRLLKAKELGADHVVNLEEKDPVSLVRQLTGGYGADIVLECSGAGSAVDMGLDIIRKQGKYTQVGLFYKPINVDFEKIAFKEVKLTGTFSQRWTAWRKSLLLMAREKVLTKPVITDVFPLSEWREAFNKCESKQGLKIILKPE